MSDDFLEDYIRGLEGLINAYRILLAIEEGKKTVKLINTERGLEKEKKKNVK